MGSRGCAFLVFGLWLVVIVAHSQESCTDFKWDVSKERALFAGPPTVMSAGIDVKSAPVVLPNRLYQLTLAPQSGVSFSVRQGKKTAGDANAGLAVLRIREAGSYRVAVDLPLWIDVVTTDSVLKPTDFQAQHDCAAPRKIVEFDLRGTKPFLLQLSAAAIAQVLLTVTPVPVRVR